MLESGPEAVERAPRLSVVIPAWNAGPFIRETLASVLAEDAPDLEVIVVDDGSTDDTAAVVESCAAPQLRLLRQANAGVSAARNRGLAAAAAPFVLFLDADDLLPPGALARHLSALEADSAAVLSYGEGVVFDDAADISRADPPRAVLRARIQGDALEALLVGNMILTGAAVARSDAARAVGGFPEGIALGEDWVFWCSLAARGTFVWLGERPILHYRRHEASAVRRLAQGPEAIKPAIEAIFAAPAVSARLSPDRRANLRGKAEAWAIRFVATERLKAKDWSEAAKGFRAALAQSPTDWRAWLLWACAAAGFLPGMIARRLK